MSCKERPPRVYSDKKGSYIINGDRKMRITPLNKNTNNNQRFQNKSENTNQNVVNVILKECRTKQKRRKMTKPKPKQPIPMKPLEQQANDANYRLYHIIQDRKREAEQQLRELIQKVQEKSIGIPSTDNSLIAMAREMKTSPSELEAKIMPTVSEQILKPVEPVVVDSGGPRSLIDVSPDEKKDTTDIIMEEPSIPDEGEDIPPSEDIPPPKAQYEDQLISNVKDLDANLPEDDEKGNEEDDIQQRVEELKGLQDKTLEAGRKFARTFLTNPDIYKAEKIRELGKKYKYTRKTGNSKPTVKQIVEFLPNDADFISDFLENYKRPERRRGVVGHYEDLYDTLISGKGKGSLMTGLFNDQIDQMLKDEPKYFGCISRDEIHKLQLDDNGKYGFVYNTVPSNKPTKYEGHWRAIYIDLDDDKSIDHYDSFGEPAEEDIQEQIKKLLEPFNLPYYLKWKDNKIVNQRSNSSNCGFFCVNFLQDRFEGIPFVDSTGFSNVMKSEKMIKDKFGKFKFLV